MKKYILIDLDGTIIDSFEGVTNSLKYALGAIGVVDKDLDKSIKHMGPPLRYSLKHFWGLGEDDIELALEMYRKKYSSEGVYQHEIYKGIDDTIKKLSKKGREIIVATSKQEEFAKAIIKHDDLDKFFLDVCGSTADGSRASKVDVMRYALESNNIKDYTRVVMVGDRYTDIEGAKALGIDVIGVLYGYGTRNELEEAGADYIVDTVKDLEDLLSNL